MSEPTVTVQLTVREARALACCSNLLGRTLDEQMPERRPVEPGPIAAESAAMKLEVALIQAGEVVL